MEKRNNFNFLALVVITLLVTITSCKNYDDDISNLRVEITELRQKIDAINSSIQSGNSIKSVTPVSNGITITLTNNESYTITNGQPGQMGTPGSVVTIGNNDNWFIDGVDTGKPSRGVDGVDGVDGGYYYPNDDGFWYKVENGVEEKTTQNWMLSGGNLTAVYANGSVTLHNVEGAEGPVTLGQAILSYLTLIPDFITENNTPVVNFSSLSTECSEIAPVTRVRYRVSPKSASVESIDTENIYFEYNNPTVVDTRSAEINPQATFISLEDGILTVEVEINAESIENENTGKIDQIMLMVPLKNGDEVNSDWAKVISTAMSSETLALVRTPKAEGDAWSTMKLTESLAETKSVNKTDPRVVEIQYGKTVDLSTVVQTMITQGEWSNYNIDTYNLEVAFDLNDESGNTIDNKSVSEVDQQQYIKIDGTVVTSLVYEIDGASPSIVDRNPIVHVFLKSKDGSFDCNVLEGFIKLNMVEDQLIPVPPVSFSVEEVINASCEEFSFRISKEQMASEFYTKSELTKEQFHNIFAWSEKSEGIGSITQVIDQTDSESYNLLWTVSTDELWNNLSSSISKSGTYTFGSNVIEVTFNANVAAEETVDISGLLISDKWFNNYSNIKHNVSIPELNINDAFKSTSTKLLDLVSINTGYSNYTYEYIFDSDQPLTTVDGISISVSADNKQLIANDGTGNQVVLTILPQESGKGDIIKFNSDSEIANTLLNKDVEFLKAKVRLVVKNECNKIIVIDGFNEGDTFLIHFFISLDSGTVYVVPNGTGSGSSWSDAMGDIQAAINKATTGNEVWVQGGTYNIAVPIETKANVNIYGSFTGNENDKNDRPKMTGSSPWDFIMPTILDGQNQTRIIQSRSATTVDGLTFTKGSGVSEYLSNQGGAIVITHADVIYQNCIIRGNNSISNGGGVLLTRGTIRKSLIENNSTPTESTSARGGGIYSNASTDSEVRIEECTIRGNYSYQGGAVRGQGNGKNILSKNKIYNNTSPEAGAALSLTSPNFELINCAIYNNESTTKKAATVLAGGKVINNNFVNNFGNIYFSSNVNPYTFTNNIVFGNEITDANDSPVSTGMSGPAGTNMQFYNNATNLNQTAIDNNQWQNEGNLYLNPSEKNAPHFRGNASFVGSAKTEDQKSELEFVDLNILSTSPCFDSGKTVIEVTEDIIGTSRHQGAAYDIGAYELAE